MKVSLSWLSEYIDLPTTDPADLADALAGLGHEVEGYEVLEPAFRGVVVGKVLDIQPHPDADKIRVCTVTTGGEPEQIICGAWNFSEGAVVPVAVPGAVLGKDFEITRRDIRGVTSNGMICSSVELGLGDDADGIMVLDPDTPIGDDFAKHVALPDVVFDLSITPNRPDAMSMIGVARDLAALYGVNVRWPDVVVHPIDEQLTVDVSIEDPVGCRRFVAREVRAVELGDSPQWMQQRLRRAGVRAINNIVDISNYVMLELGQPTHTFDFERVGGGAIVVRRAKAGERLTTLDGITRELTEDDLVVADAAVASSLAGTMGGEDSEVSPTTHHVLVEAASWDPPTVLHMSRRHNLRSEASARFERGVDPNLPLLAADRVTQLIAELANGQPLSGVADVYPTTEQPHPISLPIAEVERILGIPLGADEVAGLLRRLGMEVSGDDPIEVQVPTNRPDLTRPIDLVEEVARLHGYDAFPETLPAGPGGGLTTEQRRQRRLRSVVEGAGFSEALTFSFHGTTELGMLGVGPDDIRSRAIEVKNPLREEESLLRTTLLPGLLKATRFNTSHGRRDVALYEFGKVFYDEEAPELTVVPEQPDHLGFVAVGALQGRPVDVYTATAVWRLVARQMGLPAADVASAHVPFLHPGRGADVLMDGTVIGFVGELHPAAARAYGLTGRVAVGEVAVAPIVRQPGLWELTEPSLFPPVQFDLSFEVPDTIPGGAILAAGRRAGGELVERIELFDEFSGGSLPEGVRAVGFRYTLRAPDRTLTNEEMGPVRASIIEAARQAGATLRGAN